MVLSETRPKQISIITSSSGQDDVSPGQIFELRVTLQNLGDCDAVIDLSIDDTRSPKLKQWCSYRQQRLTLGRHQGEASSGLSANQNGEVVFTFRIPPNELPDQLEYDLVVDATADYPHIAPWRKRYQLQILPTDRITAKVSQPTLLMTPTTTPAKPALLRPGVPFTLEVWVDNRSERVDRFQLLAMGLPPDWQVITTYPRPHSQSPGLVVEPNSLGLNPGDQGQILLQLTPPLDALANSYVPTLRLKSQNHAELNLLQMMYLQVEPIYLLQPTLQTLRNQVQRQPAQFELQLRNEGNTLRRLTLRVDNLDEPKSCHYILSDDTLEILPKELQRIQLQAVPQQWWRRPLYGAGRFLNFRVELVDTEQHPLTLDSLPGNLIWMPRPWWQLLLTVLTGAGAIAALIFLFWWVFFRPPLVPRILSFEPQDARYKAANQDSARVAWRIEHPQQVQTLTLTGYDPEGIVLSGPYTYDLTDTLPAALQPFCLLQKAELACQNVETGARAPGQYQFELTVTPKGRQPRTPITQQTSSVVIDPIPAPQVVEFFAQALVYAEAEARPVANEEAPSPLTSAEFCTQKPYGTEASPDLAVNANAPPAITARGIELSWTIDAVENLAAIKLVGRNAEGQELGIKWYELASKNTFSPDITRCCEFNDQQLTCENVPTPIFDVGEYSFELTAVPREQGDGEVAAAVTESIFIQPQASKIEQFLVNGEEAPARSVFSVEEREISLAWEIVGGTSTKASLSPVPGDIPLIGAVRLPLNPEPGMTTFALQVSDASGEIITRSIIIETFDPNATDPTAAIADAFTQAVEQLNSDREATSADMPAITAPPLDAPLPANPSVVSPQELPPQFE